MQITTKTIRLREIAGGTLLFGSGPGKKAFWALLAIIEANPLVDVFSVSLDGIECVDATFARESVIALAKRFRGEKGVCLIDVPGERISDNWTFAARSIGQPITLWNSTHGTVVGPKLSMDSNRLLNHILGKRKTLACELARDLGISLNSASTRLKNLVKSGYLMRSETISPTGGIEFLYRSIC